MPEIIDKIKDIIVNKYRPEQLYMFGSAVEPDRYNPERSDLDFLIVKKTNKTQRQRYAQVRSYLRDIIIPLDLVIVTPREVHQQLEDHYSIVYEAINKGKKIYEKINE